MSTCLPNNSASGSGDGGLLVDDPSSADAVLGGCVNGSCVMMTNATFVSASAVRCAAPLLVANPGEYTVSVANDGDAFDAIHGDGGGDGLRAAAPKSGWRRGPIGCSSADTPESSSADTPERNERSTNTLPLKPHIFVPGLGGAQQPRQARPRHTLQYGTGYRYD